MLVGFPVVRWATFVEYIRSCVNILATEYHLHELACQLQLMGQVCVNSSPSSVYMQLILTDFYIYCAHIKALVTAYLLLILCLVRWAAASYV